MNFPSFPASCGGTGAASADRLGDPTLGTVTRQKGLATNTPASSRPKPHLQKCIDTETSIRFVCITPVSPQLSPQLCSPGLCSPKLFP